MTSGNEIVFRGENNQALTNSLLVAKEFGKEHKHVLETIRKLVGTSDEKSAFVENQKLTQMFELTWQELPMPVGDGTKKAPVYVMNRDGFMLLAMGFTGKKAMQFKLAYIEAFNNMEEEIRKSSKQMSQLEIAQIAINQLVEQEHRLSNVEQRLDNIENERKENERLLLSEKLSDNPVPEISMRAKIRKLVNQYSNAANVRQDFVWHKIYDTLLYAYKFSINAVKKLPGESKLDVLERKGMLGTVFDIVSRMVKDIENNK